MPETLIIGQPPIEILIRRTSAARRLSLTVSRLDGRVGMTAPPSASRRLIQDFAHSKVDWIAAQICKAVQPVQAIEVGTVPFRGENHTLRMGKVAAPQLVGAEILVPEGASSGLKLRAWLREQARHACSSYAIGFAGELGVSYRKLSVRDTRSRWGSCSSRGALMLSWRLVMAPDPVLQYVVAHEVAHLREMNHSPAFWQLVAQLTPDWETHRDWLRTHGSALHRYQFDREDGSAQGGAE